MNIIDTYLKYVKEEVGAVLSTSPLIIRKYTQHLLKGQGKYVRAQLALACAIQEGEISYDAVYAASAIELIHLASLVHDDVMDNADTRRGIETLQKVYGRKTAVICGDYILAESLNLLQKIKDKEVYIQSDISQAMVQLSLGELQQHINNGNIDITENEYFEIIKGKTASLFNASCYCGAVIGKASPEKQQLYKDLGEKIGIVFQLIDDCIDFDDDIEEARKPIESDFEQGVITLPLILALQDNPKQSLQTLTRSKINEMVLKADGVKRTKSIAQKYKEDVVQILDELELDEFKYAILENLSLKAMRI